MYRAMIATAAVLAAMGPGQGFAQAGFKNIHETLSGLKEVPVISTTGHGQFRAWIADDGSMIRWELSYADLEGAVQQAHIHFGPPNNTGGISVFLCTNLGNGPAGTQACPPPPAAVSGVALAADVIGPAAQGIEAGALAELVAAVRAGKSYVNVHTTKWPAGEIRSQIRHDRSDKH